MKKVLYQLMFCLLSMFFLVGCTNDNDNLSMLKPKVSFRIGTSAYDIQDGVSRTRSAEMSNKITKLWYRVFTADGRLVNLHNSALSPDLSNLFIEGLKDGNYTIAFLATTQESDVMVTENQNSASDPWIQNTITGSPLNSDLLYKRIEFTVGSDMPALNIDVELKRVVGRMEFNILAANEYSKRYIRKVEVSFESPFVGSNLLINGVTQGSSSITKYDITNDMSFYSLASNGTSSGTVYITAERADGTLFSKAYSFSNATIVANQLTQIQINWSHPDDNIGRMQIRTSDYNDSSFVKMFKDTETRDVMYSRTFYVNKPLQVSISENKLLVRFFSAIGIKNVKIKAQFRKYSTSFLEFAQFDSIRSFQESCFEIPALTRSCTFRADDGRDVVLPALENLTDTDVVFIVETDDPYMAKIAKITLPWRITFSKFNADNNDPKWRHMEPMHCREASVLTTNMAFMFSSDEFDNEMVTNYTGKLLDNNSVVIPLDEIRKRVKAYGGFTCGRVRNVNGLGGGRTYGLTHEVWKSHYWDFGTAAGFHKSTAYHEFGHCIGYGHTSTMTYGDQWTVLCSRVMYDLGHDGKLPVCSRWVLNTGNRTID